MHAISPFHILAIESFRRPAPDSDDVLVVEEEEVLCAGHAKEATSKTSSLPGTQPAQLFNHSYIQHALSFLGQLPL